MGWSVVVKLGKLVVGKVGAGGAVVSFKELNPLKAVSAVPSSATYQIIFFAGVVELLNLDKTYGPQGENWDFDPLRFLEGKSQEEIDDLKLKELENGRLAMMASAGMFFQIACFGHGGSPFL